MNKQKVNVFWFRRDLRLHDNAGLYHALKSNNPVLPIFVFDTDILNLLENKRDARVEFIYNALLVIQDNLRKLGSSLLVLQGRPIEVWKKLTIDFNIESVFTNHDYETYAAQRDESIRKFLLSKGIELNTFKDQVIFEKGEIIKANGTPYTVFTPYSKKWKETLRKSDYTLFNTEKHFGNFIKAKPYRIPTLKEIGFEKTGCVFPPKRLRADIIRKYDKLRDFPGAGGTSRLGVHLRFGTVSIRELVRETLRLNQTWLKELIWREFFMMILYNFPYVVNKLFRHEFESIKWRNNEEEFERWCNGETGYPFVDAGMRELNQTGYMHNRARMITASFLVKHLLIDWRWGEAYFASRLLDYELSSNNGNWQWAAGTGCDASPYFRIFNPHTQLKKFDPNLTYVRKWVPEFGTSSYPKPIVEHTFARERALATFKNAINKFKENETGNR